METSKLTYNMTAVIFALSLGACASLPDNTGRTESHAFEDTRDTILGRSVNLRSRTHTGDSGFYLLGNGLDAFVARAALAHLAERSIDTQYYMIHNDVVGGLFVDQLYKAADRGVRVRLLVDDIDQGAGISVRRFWICTRISRFEFLIRSAAISGAASSL